MLMMGTKLRIMTILGYLSRNTIEPYKGSEILFPYPHKTTSRIISLCIEASEMLAMSWMPFNLLWTLELSPPYLKCDRQETYNL